MTAGLRLSPTVPAVPTASPPSRPEPRPEPPAEARELRSRRGLPVGWPLTAMLVGFPIWWALGLANFVYLFVAVPMAWQLRTKRPLRLPRGFMLWALFLVWVLLSVSALGLQAPGTLHSSGQHLVQGFTLRLLNYVAETVILLYVGNLSENELSRLRIVRMLAIFFVYAAVGGFAALLAPNFAFDSPLEILLPHSLANNPSVALYVHPALAQVQTVLGHSAPRPEAPFDYTNVWGANLTILGAFFVVAWWTYGTRRQRLAVLPLVLFALVPFIYSLNRGAWIGVGLLAVWVAVSTAVRGNVRLLGGIIAAVAAGLLVVALSPLHTVVSERLAHPKSNTIRTSLSHQAYVGARSSPIIGYGSNRQVIGSTNSIAVGKTKNCHNCGNAGIGSNGAFWLILFAQGFVGIGLFSLFFLVVVVRGRRDPTPLGIAATGVAAVSLFYNFFYPGAGSSLTLYLIAIGLLWRNEQALSGQVPVALNWREAA